MLVLIFRYKSHVKIHFDFHNMIWSIVPLELYPFYAFYSLGVYITYYFCSFYSFYIFYSLCGHRGNITYTFAFIHIIRREIFAIIQTLSLVKQCTITNINLNLISI